MKKVEKFCKNIIKVVETTPQLAIYKRDFLTFVDMVLDYTKGKYKYVSKSSKYVVAICVFYILFPFKFRKVPFFKEINNVSVLLFMIKMLKKEIGFYRIFKMQNL